MLYNEHAEHYKFGHFKVTNINEEEFRSELSKLLQKHKGGLVTYANAHTYCLSVTDSSVRKINDTSDIVLIDGFGFIFGGRFLRKKLKSKLALTNLDSDISRVLVENDSKLFLLGAKSGIAELASARMRKKNPDLNIVGVHHGYFESREEENIMNYIKQSKANVIVVGMGSPLQDMWYLRNKKHLGSVVCILGGQCLEYWAGIEPPPPPWMSRNGLAWLYRTLRHPHRMLPRYTKVIPMFVLNMVKLKIATFLGKE